MNKSLDPQPKGPTTTFGHCVICGHEVSFQFDNGIITPQLQNAWGITDAMADAFNYRESQFCSFCGGSLRVRQLCTAIIQTFSEMSGRTYDSFPELLEDEEFRSLRIAEINACGTFHNYLKQHPNLCYSEYVPGVPCGSEYNGIRCEDLQELTYPNDYFDIILTSDTLEHVPDPDKAWSEIHRTLKLGGYHIFTIPVVPSQPVTKQRARLSGGRTEYLTEPAYHGREWGTEDLLVYTDFAMDVVGALNKLGLSTEVLYYKQGNNDVAFVFRSLKQRVTDVTKMEPAKLEWTGERFLPWIAGAQIHYEHIHRYAFAAHLVKGKKVLDLACGEGYGTYMLAKEAEYVAGVEIDKTTVQHARSRYIKDNLEFREGSILAIPIEGERKFDVVVCFEAIEHIAEHDKLLSEVNRLLKDDGLFIVSTPNKTIYTDEPDYHNPFHIKELDFDEFKSLLRQYFAHMHIFGQRVYAGSNMWSIHQHKSRGYIEEVVKKGDMEFYFEEKISKEPLYFIALASNASLKPFISITDSWLTDASNALFNDYESRRLDELNHTIANLETNLQEKVTHIAELETTLQEKISQISQIQRSIPMQLVNRYQRVVKKLLRPGTRRRYYYELGLAGIRIVLNEGWREGWRRFWSCFRGWLGRRITEHPQATFPRLYLLKTAKQPMSTTSDVQKDAHAQSLPRVDVVTATYNSSRFVKDLVQSLQESDYPANLITVTVVDNSSSDDTLKILQSISKARCFTSFEVIDAARNLGYGKAVNLAAKTGNAPYILVVNPDVKFVPDCLSILVKHAVCDAEACLWEPRQFPYEHPKYYDPLTLETIWSSGAAFLVRRDKFEELGGFDESFFLYGEDVDLSFRMWNSGGKCRYVPSAVLWHYAYSKPGEVKPLQWYYSLRNNLLIRYKFGRMSDVIKGYMLLFGALVSGDAIPSASLRVLSAFFSHLKLIPPILMWRLRTSRAVFKNYRFTGWDFEMSKLGAFYENRPSAEKPLVTVLIRTKERPSYLRDALRSVANQTYRPIEVVVVEDGPATSEAVIDEFAGTPGLEVKYRPLGVSRGRCFAGNEALRLASGRFLNFLDDDDLFFPDHIEVLVQALLSHSLQYKAAYSGSFMVKASYTTEAILPHEFNSFFNQYCKDELKTRNLFPVQAVMFHRDLYDSLGGLDEGAEGLEDWDIWLRYAKATDFLAVEKTTSEFRIPKDPTLISERQSSLDRLYWFVRKRHELL